ncbi:hypothetical protein P691DRAFT_775618 [Macrolepiota fuliginosa MF-IS2]|uniref:RRM domain-containing protein n=1 Tax=Macrolepiota fuliginosa MF-IS2 TaxID=1400762 RepID=A0A9P6C483_9AGAR|nr:hypothetical protein P691DRAFT_775618 [Macrolepiota fuliginosa MF-IS2]
MINITTTPSTSTTTTSLPSNTHQPKLTKKQKKALAFRDKPTKTKSKVKNFPDEDEHELAQMENPNVTLVEKSRRNHDARDQDQVGGMEGQSGEGAEGGSEKTCASSKGARDVALPAQESQSQSHPHHQQQQRSQRNRKRDGEERGGERDGQDKKQGKKRKREQLDDGVDGAGSGQGVSEKNKKRKREKVESGVGHAKEESEGKEEMSEGEGEGKKGSGKGRGPQRFILFIGNLKYTTSIDSIKAHFSACDAPPEVRLLTPKSSSAGKTTTKSKGCAFLEFSDRTSIQQALKLHHSMLEGRMINVELTAGGGGKGEKRMEKLRERNKELLGQRKKKAEKNSKDGSLPSRPDKPQRYSATSGIEQSSPEKKRTWTVGDVAEDEVHRGGMKHKTERTRGSRKSKVKDWGTGVNAIPVS